ncbi:aquaporin Z [Sediminihabitans luteus]|uniref:Aquaporin Z n=1 Tax=Sediminihabitans luteus TaxID=1138585 RepID=A0A2M9CYX6_9CELL|nr:aquaporin [Sediminihabitans luteus]PJJ77142.1 aquaporin Z [Sediminihabitans luteus]GII98590.1 hypothetical protein Slu03_09680 [Sediminihabitans luteus]
MSQDFAAPAATAPAPAPAVTDAETATPHVGTRMLVEAFGTFFLVLAICGVALYGRFTNSSLTLAVALAGGIAVLAAIAAVGHISGGHFNPAVTLGAAIAGRTEWINVPLYWVSQLVGGIAAAFVLWATLPSGALPILAQLGAVDPDTTKAKFFAGVANGYGDNSPLAAATSGAFSFDLTSALLIEVLATAVFVGVILGVTSKRANTKLAPIAIGLALASLIMVTAPFTNASLNPARSTAAAVFAGDWALSQLWLFWVAPLVGGAIAGLFALSFAPLKNDVVAAGETDALATEYEAAAVNNAPFGASEAVVAPTAPVAAEPVVAEPAVAEPAAPAPAPAEPVAAADDSVVDDTTVTRAPAADGSAEARSAEDGDETPEQPKA